LATVFLWVTDYRFVSRDQETNMAAMCARHGTGTIECFRRQCVCC